MNIEGKTEKGYALVLVLLMLTIFSILALSFMAYSQNTATQVENTETKIQSIDLAEMGAEYYKYAIESMSEQIKNQAISYAEGEIYRLISTDPIFLEYDDEMIEQLVEDIAFDEYEDKMRSTLDAQTDQEPFLVDEEEENGYQIAMNANNLHFNKQEKSMKTTYRSVGIVNGEPGQVIEVDVQINFKEIVVAVERVNPDSGPGNSDEKEIFAYIEEPTEFDDKQTCASSIANGSLEGISCLISGKTFGNNDLSLDNATLKVNGDLVMGKTKNEDLNNSLIYVTGNYSNSNNGNWAMSNARIYVGKDANFGNLNHVSHVTIVVEEKANFHNKIETGPALVCVGELGSLKSHGTNVEVYSKEDHPEQFEAGGKCSGSKSGDLKPEIEYIEWEAKPMEINYIYK